MYPTYFPLVYSMLTLKKVQRSANGMQGPYTYKSSDLMVGVLLVPITKKPESLDWEATKGIRSRAANP